MKWAALVMAATLSVPCLASENAGMSEEKIKATVTAVVDASNRLWMAGSKPEDIEALFALYADDFVYVHEAHGGTYSRQQLYNNSVRAQGAGRYSNTAPHYKVVNIIPGLNAAAVEKQVIKSGKTHLAVFEFKGEKIAKITEYWK